MYIDLTHNFSAHMPVFPGDKAAAILQIAQVSKEGTCNHFLKTGMHVGTHMDAPGHMLEQGKLLYEYPVEKFFGRGVQVDVRGKQAADIDCLNGLNVARGDFVLLMFGWSDKFQNPEYYQNYPQVTEGLAKQLVKLGVSVLGMDTPSPDYAPYEIHKILLREGILIIENLTNLDALSAHPKFEIIALPVKLETEAAPCRVVAKIHE